MKKNKGNNKGVPYLCLREPGVGSLSGEPSLESLLKLVKPKCAKIGKRQCKIRRKVEKGREKKSTLRKQNQIEIQIKFKMKMRELCSNQVFCMGNV